MPDRQDWDWNTAEKKIPLNNWRQTYRWVEEPQVSPDGEKIAAIVNIDEGEFTIAVNKERWESVFDKIWYLRFSPVGSATALVSTMGEWSVAVDGQSWENQYGYVWNTQFSRDGMQTAVACQQEMKYGMAINDRLWDATYSNMTDGALSPNGERSAAVVQVLNFGSAEIEPYQQGAYTVAVDGTAWKNRFVNVWKPVFDSGGTKVAAQVRTSLYDYTIAVDETTWEKAYAMVWEPVFHPTEHHVVAPVRTEGKWTLAKNGNIFWNDRYGQVWHQAYSDDGSKLAAIVSPKYGKWTMAVDDRPWSVLLGDMVADWAFSANGDTLAAVYKQGHRWSVAVNDRNWQHSFEMVFAPVISDDGQYTAAKVERDGKYTLAVNDHIWINRCDAVWDPIFSPNSQLILARTIENNTYYRRVIPVSEIIAG